FIVDVVDVIHADGDPWRNSLLPTALNPAGVDINAILMKLPGSLNPFPCVLAIFPRHACEQRLIVRTLRVVAFPDWVPDLTGVASALAIDIEHQLSDLCVGVLVDPGINFVSSQVLVGPGKEVVTAVFVQAKSPSALRDHRPFGLGGPGSSASHFVR